MLSESESLKTTASLRVINDVACTRCGCLCDDLQVTVDGPRVVDVSIPGSDCSIAQSWFRAQRGDAEGDAFINGQRVAVPEALAESVRLLAEASSPLVYGLTHCSTDGQRAAAALADRIGAYLDVASSPAQSAALSAFQNAGASTSTLGVVRERADLVIYWGCDPQSTHPRHLSRFVEATGRWAPEGRGSRKVISIGPDANRLATADTSIELTNGRDAEFIATLRSLVASDTENEIPDVAGVSGAVVADLVEQIRTCKYGVIFYGEAIVENATDTYTVESLHRLVTELNADARFTLRYMSVGGNAPGAANVLTWQTGYPANVDLTAGYPQYRPGECDATKLLEDGVVDAALIVGEESLETLSSAAIARLQEIPVIVLTHPGVDLGINAAVQFVTAKPGVHEKGTAYRMDEVALPLRPLFDWEWDLITDESVLDSIGRTIEACTRTGTPIG